MSNHPIIGLTGRAGTGKDTVRGILEAEHGFTGLAFADPIRSMLRDLLESNGIGGDYMGRRALKEAIIPELGVSYRHMAQTLGTEWGRSLQPDFWLRIADAFISGIASNTFGPLAFVVSDVRFANEAVWVRERGGVIWRVERPGVAPVREHVSEAEIDLITPDRTIRNGGSIEDLRGEVFGALEALA